MRGECIFSFSRGKYISSGQKKSVLWIIIAQKYAVAHISVVCREKREGVLSPQKGNQTVLDLYNMTFLVAIPYIVEM